MGAFVLILFAHVGIMGKDNSNALATAYFQSEKACYAAGNAAKKMTSNSVKSIEFVCMPTN